MSHFGRVNRRTVLRGVGTSLALPWLEAMLPRARGASDDSKPVTRMAFIYVPNGAHMDDWTPTLAGDDFELPYILEPLKPHRDQLLVLSGLACDKARAHGDGGGDHARSAAAFLTGRQAKKTDGADICAGVSVDQVAAARIGNRTRFGSLELGCEGGRQAGGCDSGYSCAYSNSISWRGESTPNAKEINPKLVFERLFSLGASSESAERSASRRADRRSVLDYVLEDARDLERQLGGHDRRKIDEYLSAVREVEIRIARAESEPVEPPAGAAAPAGIPGDFGEHMRLMFDLTTLAFQTDLTRVITFAIANEGSNRPYPQIGISEGHHDLSHHGGDAAKQQKIREINRFHITQFAYLLEKLAAVREGEQSLLENSMILYGSGIADGNRHQHDDLPVLLAGRSSGTIRSARHMRYRSETPISNLYLAMLDRMESSTDRFGDSDGKLELG